MPPPSRFTQPFYFPLVPLCVRNGQETFSSLLWPLSSKDMSSWWKVCTMSPAHLTWKTGARVSLANSMW